MRRAQVLSVAAILAVPWVYAAAHAPASANASPEAIGIYAIFLDQYLGENGHANLGKLTTVMSEQNRHDYQECISRTHFSLPADNVPQSLDGSVLSQRSNVRFIDANTWHAHDPQDSIRAGHRIGDAVAEGFESGLLELSDIAYDEQHRTAMFFYSFACGSLCGNGGPVFFDKTPHGWKQRQVNCGGWVS